jgi:hypothetical protein
MKQAAKNIQATQTRFNENDEKHADLVIKLDAADFTKPSQELVIIKKILIATLVVAIVTVPCTWLALRFVG